MKKPLLAVLMLLLCFAIAGCRSGQPIQNFTNQPMPADISKKPRTMAEVRTAIIKGGAERGWAMNDINNSTLRGVLDVRNKHHAEVDITYNTSSYSINYVSSNNLAENNGKIHPQYNNWVINLNQSIKKYLSLE